MDSLVTDDLEAGDGQKLSVVAYGALLDMILRGTIAAGEPSVASPFASTPLIASMIRPISPPDAMRLAEAPSCWVAATRTRTCSRSPGAITCAR